MKNISIKIVQNNGNVKQLNLGIPYNADVAEFLKTQPYLTLARGQHFFVKEADTCVCCVTLSINDKDIPLLEERLNEYVSNLKTNF